MVILKSLTPFLSGIRTGSNWNLDIYVETKSTFQYVEICPCTHKKSWNSNSVRKCCFRRGFPYISKLLCNYTGWIHTNRERSELERDSKEESKWEQRERKDSHRSQVWTLMVKKKQTATLLKRKSWRFSKHIATVTNRGQRHLNRFSHRCFFPTVRTQMEPHTGISLLWHYMSVRFMYFFIFLLLKSIFWKASLFTCYLVRGC